MRLGLDAVNAVAVTALQRVQHGHRRSHIMAVYASVLATILSALSCCVRTAGFTIHMYVLYIVVIVRLMVQKHSDT